MELSVVGNCWNCGAGLSVSDYGRGDSCSKCRRDTHVCKNCLHHDVTYNNQCRENQADRVVEKDRANFCDYLKPRSGSGIGGKNATDLRAAAEMLFKKKN